MSKLWDLDGEGLMFICVILEFHINNLYIIEQFILYILQVNYGPNKKIEMHINLHDVCFHIAVVLIAS